MNFASTIATKTCIKSCSKNFANGPSKLDLLPKPLTYSKITVIGSAVASRSEDPNFPPIQACDAADEGVSLTAGLSFTDYEGRTYAGSGAVTTYYASCSNRQLTKPIIMLDGIDFEEKSRDGITVYSDFLNY
ncbi:hypothetical protein GCM10022406_16270 [Hymenobacter algoricola]|uniref:TonB-dependent receptor plug domain-containing protein n=1 Tax=Hymenobacter algoricola TaxID=486267 RepID=A0ABP7MXW2_9BACT